MLINQGGADLFGVYERKILLTLDRIDTSLGIREISRITEIPKDSVKKILEKFTAVGLLIEYHGGAQRRHWSQNSLHIFWPSIRDILYIETRIFEELRKTFKPLTDLGATLALFGSVARGDSISVSDLDLIVLYPDKMADKVEFSTWLGLQGKPLTLMLGNNVQIFDTTYQDFFEMIKIKDPIIDSWEKDAITLAGPDIKDMIRKAKHVRHKNNEFGRS